MTLACPNCQSQYNLDDSRIPAAGMQLRCPKCGTTFNVTRQGAAAAGPVELPAPAGARPPPAIPRAPTGTAVPLPGVGLRPPSSAVISAPPPPSPTRKPTSPELDPNELFGPGDELPADAPSSAPGAMDSMDVDVDDSASRQTFDPPSLDLGADLGMNVPQMGPARRPPTLGEAPPPPPSMSRAPAESLEVLDPRASAPRPPPSIGRTGPKRRYQVKRASGKIFGPFDEDRILKMLADGELAGNESVKSEDGEWEPLANHSAFSGAVPRQAPTERSLSGQSGAADPAADAAPVGVSGRDPEALRKLQQVYGDRMAAVAMVDVVPFRERIQKYVPLIVGGSIGFVVLLLGLSLGFTTYGVFGRFLIFGPPHVFSSSTAGQALAKARAGLRTGTYGSLKLAIAEGARAHAASGLAVDVVGVMAQSASALALEAPGEGSGDVSKAKTAIAGALDYGPKDPDVLRGEAALALAEGQSSQAKAFLDGALKKQPNNVEGLYLLSQALKGQDNARAQQTLKQALAADPKFAKAHLALATLLQATGDVAGALVEAQKAVEVDAEQARAQLLVEQLSFASGKSLDASAEDRLRALSDEKSGLSPAQRAAALALVASVELKAGHLPQGKKELEGALKIDPRNREALVAEAAMLLQLHHGAEALSALAPIASLAAKDLDVADILAQVQIDQGHYADANQTIAPQLTLHPDNARLETTKGIASAFLGKADEAEKLLLASLKADPSLAETHLGLGQLYLSRNQLDKSHAEFDAALAKAPQSSRAHTGFAQLLMAQGNREAARSELSTAIGLDPDNAEAHFLLGKLLRQIGQLDPALRELRTTERLDNKFPGVHLAIGALLEQRDSFSEAATAYKVGTEVDPQDPPTWRALGRALREQGDFDGSLEALNKSANLNSQDSEVHVELALTLLKKTDNGKALVEAKSAIEANEKNPNAWRAQGRVQLAIGDNRSALTGLDKSAELDPASAETQQLRGETLTLLKEYGPAVDAYRKAIALDPLRGALLLEIGQVQVRQKDYAEALKSYKAALAHNPPYVEAYYLMARALDESGKSKDAVKFYELAAKLDTQNAMPYRYLGYYFKSLGQGKKAVSAFQTYLAKKPDADDKDVITEELGFLKGG